MTSTNDGKDVKINQSCCLKGKAYYIELYKSLEARLSSECELRDRTQLLCEAWRRIYCLCRHSTPSTHPHLISWVQWHTAKVILQTEWKSEDSKDERASLDQAIDAFLEEVQNAAKGRHGVLLLWEKQLSQRAEWFKNNLGNPWEHPMLKILLVPQSETSDDEVLEWLKGETGIVFVTRLRQLAASKCHDLALSLASTVMDRVRATTVLKPDAVQGAEKVDKDSKEKPKPVCDKSTFARSLKREAGFTDDVWEWLIDIEFILLHKGDGRSRCIELAKQTPLRNGYHLVERLHKRHETSSTKKKEKLWKNAKDVATLIAQVVIARCMVVPLCVGVCRSALGGCARALARWLTAAKLPAAANALAAPAATAAHLYTLAVAVAHETKNKEEMRPFVCELYVRAITAGMNEVERLKLKTEKEPEARAMEQILSSWFINLGSLLHASDRFNWECILTAFSVHPSPNMYEKIKEAPMLRPVNVDPQESKSEATSDFGSWANDSRSQTNLVKTSETLNMIQSQNQANVLSTAILAEGEALGLSPELCQDIAMLLSGPRLKTLSWDMDRNLLLDNCKTYMERTHGGTRALTTELKYLNLDPKNFEHLPEEEDDENDIYYGIEKGYEHLVEFQEDVWQDVIQSGDDDEESLTETAVSSSDDSVTRFVQRKKKPKKCIISSVVECDPLSYLSEAETEKKNERPHSKERSKTKERRKKKVAEDPLKIDPLGTDLGKDKKVNKIKEKKEKRERKKKEKVKPNANIITDSDYDSQGKSSLNSISEGNEEIVYDGIYSMDELKSPQRFQDKMGFLKNNEFSVSNGTVLINNPTVNTAQYSGNINVMSSSSIVSRSSSTPSPTIQTVSEDVKRSLTWLIERRQYSKSPQAASLLLKNEPKISMTITRPGGAIPTQISPKVVSIPEIPKAYIEKRTGTIPANQILINNKPQPLKSYPNKTMSKDYIPTNLINEVKPLNKLTSKEMALLKPKCTSAGQNSFKQFLRQLQDSNNAGTGSELLPQQSVQNEIKPISRVPPVIPHKSEHKPPQSAKLVQQKREALNTFSRLSYMHKNKIIDKRQIIDSIIEHQSRMLQQSPINEHNFERLLAEHKESKVRFLQSSNPELQISRVIKSKCKEKKEQEKSTALMKDHPLLINVLQSGHSVNESQKVPDRDPKHVPITPANVSVLSEKDQNDLLLLLRQKSKMNSSFTQFRNETSASVKTMQDSIKPSAHLGMSVSNWDSFNTNVIEATPSCSKINDNNKRKTEVSEIVKSTTTVVENDKPQTDWEEVMNAILAHKTPSRGPNALDLALKKTQKSCERLRNHRIIKSSDALKKSSSDLNKATSEVTLLGPAKISKPTHSDPPIANNTLTSKSNTVSSRVEMNFNELTPKETNTNYKETTILNNNLKAPKHQPVEFKIQNYEILKRSNQIEKKIPVEAKKKQFTFTLPKEEDPFISGLPVSDYDLLEELMDDELRQEIGELSDDDFNTAANICKDMKNVKQNQLISKPVSNLIDINKQVIITTAKSDVGCVSKVDAKRQLQTPLHNVLNTHGIAVPQSKVNNVTKPVLKRMDMKQPLKLQSPEVIQNLPAKIILTKNNVTNEYPAVNETNANNIRTIEPSVLVIPQVPMQNVILMGTNVCNTYPAVEAQIPVTNVYFSQPNISLYQSSQYTAPVVGPVIIGNTMTISTPILNRPSTTAVAFPTALQKLSFDEPAQPIDTQKNVKSKIEKCHTSNQLIEDITLKSDSVTTDFNSSKIENKVISKVQKKRENKAEIEFPTTSQNHSLDKLANTIHTQKNVKRKFEKFQTSNQILKDITLISEYDGDTTDFNSNKNEIKVQEKRENQAENEFPTTTQNLSLDELANPIQKQKHLKSKFVKFQTSNKSLKDITPKSDDVATDFNLNKNEIKVQEKRENKTENELPTTSQNPSFDELANPIHTQKNLKSKFEKFQTSNQLLKDITLKSDDVTNDFNSNKNEIKVQEKRENKAENEFPTTLQNPSFDELANPIHTQKNVKSKFEKFQTSNQLLKDITPKSDDVATDFNSNKNEIKVQEKRENKAENEFPTTSQNPSFDELANPIHTEKNVKSKFEKFQTSNQLIKDITLKSDDVTKDFNSNKNEIKVQEKRENKAENEFLTTSQNPSFDELANPIHTQKNVKSKFEKFQTSNQLLKDITPKSDGVTTDFNSNKKKTKVLSKVHQRQENKEENKISTTLQKPSFDKPVKLIPANKNGKPKIQKSNTSNRLVEDNTPKSDDDTREFNPNKNERKVMSDVHKNQKNKATNKFITALQEPFFDDPAKPIDTQKNEISEIEKCHTINQLIEDITLKSDGVTTELDSTKHDRKVLSEVQEKQEIKAENNDSIKTRSQRLSLENNSKKNTKDLERLQRKRMHIISRKIYHGRNSVPIPLTYAPLKPIITANIDKRNRVNTKVKQVIDPIKLVNVSGAMDSSENLKENNTTECRRISLRSSNKLKVTVPDEVVPKISSGRKTKVRLKVNSSEKDEVKTTENCTTNKKVVVITKKCPVKRLNKTCKKLKKTSIKVKRKSKTGRDDTTKYKGDSVPTLMDNIVNLEGQLAGAMILKTAIEPIVDHETTEEVDNLSENAGILRNSTIVTDSLIKELPETSVDKPHKDSNHTIISKDKKVGSIVIRKIKANEHEIAKNNMFSLIQKQEINVNTSSTNQKPSINTTVEDQLNHITEQNLTDGNIELANILPKIQHLLKPKVKQGVLVEKLMIKKAKKITDEKSILKTQHQDNNAIKSKAYKLKIDPLKRKELSYKKLKLKSKQIKMNPAVLKDLDQVKKDNMVLIKESNEIKNSAITPKKFNLTKNTCPPEEIKQTNLLTVTNIEPNLKKYSTSPKESNQRTINLRTTEPIAAVTQKELNSTKHKVTPKETKRMKLATVTNKDLNPKKVATTPNESSRRKIDIVTPIESNKYTVTKDSNQCKNDMVLLKVCNQIKMAAVTQKEFNSTADTVTPQERKEMKLSTVTNKKPKPNEDATAPKGENQKKINYITPIEPNSDSVIPIELNHLDLVLNKELKPKIDATPPKESNKKKTDYVVPIESNSSKNYVSKVINQTKHNEPIEQAQTDIHKAKEIANIITVNSLEKNKGLNIASASVIKTNKPNQNSIKPVPLNSIKSEEISQNFKDQIIFEHLPSSPDEPGKKYVRVKLPNKRTFKATVQGMHVDVDSLFADPAFKSILLNNLTNRHEYTLNIKQVSTRDKNDPKKVDTRIEEVNLAPGRMPGKIETVSLLSDDDEEVQSQTFITEFGKYKIKTMDKDLFLKHQKKIDQKSHVQLDRIEFKQRATVTKPISLDSSPEPVKLLMCDKVYPTFVDVGSNSKNESNSRIESDVIEIDDSSNDSTDVVPKLKEDINMLKDLLIKDLCAEKILDETEIYTEMINTISESIIQSPTKLNDCFVKLTNCDDLVKQYNQIKTVHSNCPVDLMCCVDEVVYDKLNERSELKTYDLSSEDTVHDIYTSDNVEEDTSLLSRSGSFSILNDFSLYENETASTPISKKNTELDRSSPVMEVFDNITSLFNRIASNNITKIYHENIITCSCDSEWFATKRNLYTVENFNNKDKKAIIQPKHTNNVPKLQVLVLRFLETNNVIHYLKRISNKNNYILNRPALKMKRKLKSEVNTVATKIARTGKSTFMKYSNEAPKQSTFDASYTKINCYTDTDCSKQSNTVLTTNIYLEDLFISCDSPMIMANNSIILDSFVSNIEKVDRQKSVTCMQPIFKDINEQNTTDICIIDGRNTAMEEEDSKSLNHNILVDKKLDSMDQGNNIHIETKCLQEESYNTHTFCKEENTINQKVALNDFYLEGKAKTEARVAHEHSVLDSIDSVFAGKCSVGCDDLVQSINDATKLIGNERADSNKCIIDMKGFKNNEVVDQVKVDIRLEDKEAKINEKLKYELRNTVSEDSVLADQDLEGCKGLVHSKNYVTKCYGTGMRCSNINILDDTNIYEDYETVDKGDIDSCLENRKANVNAETLCEHPYIVSENVDFADKDFGSCNYLAPRRKSNEKINLSGTEILDSYKETDSKIVSKDHDKITAACEDSRLRKSDKVANTVEFLNKCDKVASTVEINLQEIDELQEMNKNIEITNEKMVYESACQDSVKNRTDVASDIDSDMKEINNVTNEKKICESSSDDLGQTQSDNVDNSVEIDMQKNYKDIENTNGTMIYEDAFEHSAQTQIDNVTNAHAIELHDKNNDIKIANENIISLAHCEDPRQYHSDNVGNLVETESQEQDKYNKIRNEKMICELPCENSEQIQIDNVANDMTDIELQETNKDIEITNENIICRESSEDSEQNQSDNVVNSVEIDMQEMSKDIKIMNQIMNCGDDCDDDDSAENQSDNVANTCEIELQETKQDIKITNQQIICLPSIEDSDQYQSDKVTNSVATELQEINKDIEIRSARKICESVREHSGQIQIENLAKDIEIELQKIDENINEKMICGVSSEDSGQNQSENVANPVKIDIQEMNKDAEISREISRQYLSDKVANTGEFKLQDTYIGIEITNEKIICEKNLNEIPYQQKKVQTSDNIVNAVEIELQQMNSYNEITSEKTICETARDYKRSNQSDNQATTVQIELQETSNGIEITNEEMICEDPGQDKNEKLVSDVKIDFRKMDIDVKLTNEKTVCQVACEGRRQFQNINVDSAVEKDLQVINTNIEITNEKMISETSCEYSGQNQSDSVANAFEIEMKGMHNDIKVTNKIRVCEASREDVRQNQSLGESNTVEIEFQEMKKNIEFTNEKIIYEDVVIEKEVQVNDDLLPSDNVIFVKSGNTELKNIDTNADLDVGDIPSEDMTTEEANESCELLSQNDSDNLMKSREVETFNLNYQIEINKRLDDDAKITLKDDIFLQDVDDNVTKIDLIKQSKIKNHNTQIIRGKTLCEGAEKDKEFSKDLRECELIVTQSNETVPKKNTGVDLLKYSLFNTETTDEIIGNDKIVAAASTNTVVNYTEVLEEGYSVTRIDGIQLAKQKTCYNIDLIDNKEKNSKIEDIVSRVTRDEGIIKESLIFSTENYVLEVNSLDHEYECLLPGEVDQTKENNLPVSEGTVASCQLSDKFVQRKYLKKSTNIEELNGINCSDEKSCSDLSETVVSMNSDDIIDDLDLSCDETQPTPIMSCIGDLNVQDETQIVSKKDVTCQTNIGIQFNVTFKANHSENVLESVDIEGTDHQTVLDSPISCCSNRDLEFPENNSLEETEADLETERDSIGIYSLHEDITKEENSVVGKEVTIDTSLNEIIGNPGCELKGIEYVDPELGTCYLFKVVETISNEISRRDNLEDIVDDIGTVRKNDLVSETINQHDSDLKLEVIVPKYTYSKKSVHQRTFTDCSSEKRCRRAIKRKSSSTETRVDKKYRKGKNIDYPKFTETAISASAYGKEYKSLIDYSSSLKFSYSRPFHKDYIDVHELLRKWPIRQPERQSEVNMELDETLFIDIEDINNPKIIVDPTSMTLVEEIDAEFKEVDSSNDDNEINFKMGFGEGSGRVIQNLEVGDDISKVSAATLSDVKQTQPFLLSENCVINSHKNSSSRDDQIQQLKKYVTYINLKEKVRTFFKKTTLELNLCWTMENKKSDYSNRDILNTFPFDLYSSEFIEPPLIETKVNVVQVGQLPVSAAAQNPVTCDPRVTHVSDASPSQCSVENTSNDDPQSAIKTEYTELTTADLSLPLQDYSQHEQSMGLESHEASNLPMNDENIPIETEIKSIVKIELMEELPEDKEEETDETIDNNDTQSDKQVNNIDYSFDTSNTSVSPDDSNFQMLFNSDKQNMTESFPPQKQNGSSEKTDQIAHAMNAAGITTTADTITNNRAHALVNILSQKVRQGTVNVGPNQTATNTFPKASINAMSLQQALAQILPPPLNQSTDSNQQVPSTSVTPQVLHIVQGKNASGNQITLVDNSQQSVINTPNTTPVLHIVQNKGVTGGTTSTAATPHTNSFSGLSLMDTGLQQGGNQLLHIVNTGNQKNNNAGQLLKRVNLLTNLTNVQGGNEQKMVQFVCKSADGKAIQLPHQRSMVLRLQPIETPNIQTNPQKHIETQDLSPNLAGVNTALSKETVTSQEIKSRSVYEENYAKFIQNSSTKPPAPEKSTSLPKFNQAFGKQVYQDGTQKNEMNNGNTHIQASTTNSDSTECQQSDNAINIDHINQISSPPLLLRKTPAPTSQPQSNLAQQIKQTIAPMNLQTMHGGVIYTRQIPVNIGGGQTINLITVPSTELIDDSNQKPHSDIKFTNQGEIEPSIIKIVPQSQPPPNAEVTQEDNAHLGVSSEHAHHQPQPVLTQMRIKLPMLSKAPQMVSGARVVRPSFFQIQRNVIGGANQPVYQQLVLTAAPQLGQQTIRLPQMQTRNQIKVPTESQSSTESQMSSSTLEQLREFDLVLEQVKERSTVQPNIGSNTTFPKLHTPSTDTTDGTASVSSTSTESTQQVLYSIGNNQPMNMTYVSRKATVTTPTTSTFVRSPDSSGIADSPTSSNHVQISHTVTTEPSTNENPVQTKPVKVSSKSKSRPKSSSNPPNTLKLNTVPPKTTTQKPLEDEQTTQRILYILAEYKEQVENSPDKDKPAPRRRSNPPSNPSGSSKRKKSSSSSRRSGGRDLSPVHGDDTCRTMGSEDSSCGTSQGDCNESCLDSHSPQDSPRKVVRKLTFEHETPATQPRPQPQRNVIVADGQTITVARGTAGKPATAVLMPANYILPVSMVKGGQQIAIVTNRGPKLLTVGGEGGATNALLLQRLIGPAGLKPVLARPGVRHVRLPTTALHNLQAFNLTTTTTVQPPNSKASPVPAPTPPELVESRAASSPWTNRESQDVKPERSSSPEGSEPWNMPSSVDAHDYSYEETVRAENMERTVLDAIPDRYSPDMEAQRIFDKMFDVDSKKSYIDSPRCGYDIDTSDCDEKGYHQKKDGPSHRQQRLTHVSAAALRHKYAILEHELRLQKSLSEECEDLGVDSPSASELFPEAELLFAASPAHDHTQDQAHHSHTPQPTILNQSGIPQPDIDDQIATDHLLPRNDIQGGHDLNLGLEDVGVVTVSEDGMQATIALDQEEFARSHPNTTFHSEPTDDVQVQPFTISGLKSRHITSTIFHANRVPGTVLMTAPQATVISQATGESSGVQNAVKYSDIDNMINSLPSTHSNNINLSSVLVKDDGLTRFDSILNDSRELHLSNTASAIVHSAGNATQVIRRVCYDDDKRDTRFLMDDPDAIIAGDDAKMIAEDSSRDLESMAGDVDDDRSSPERHAELFWESNSASERSESRRPLDFSSDSDKCCKSPSFDETNSTDSSGVGTHMRLDSVIKEARGIERSGSADGSSADDTHPPLRTYPPKRLYHSLEGDMERSLSGKTRAGERSPDRLEVRRRASGRGVVKRGCHCCNGSPAPSRPKKSRQRKPTMDFSSNN